MSKLFAHIDEENDENIRYGVIEYDEDSGGYFLFLHQHLEEGCLYDHWYETKQEALDYAFEAWSIPEGKWRDLL